MATQESLAIACDTACTRIEQSITKLTGQGLVQSLPRTHRDKGVLRKQQLETIAGMLESYLSFSTVEIVDIKELREIYENLYDKPSIPTWSKKKLTSEIEIMYTRQARDAGGRT